MHYQLSIDSTDHLDKSPYIILLMKSIIQNSLNLEILRVLCALILTPTIRITEITGIDFVL